jgi:hypothetical protein
MFEGLPLEAILKEWGPSGLVALTVIMILTGRLVPRSFYREKVAEAKEWKAVATTAVETNRELLEYARTADAILKALPRGGTTQ